MHFINERLEAVRELLLVGVPVAEAGIVVVALSEPAIVDDETVHSKSRGLFGEFHLSGCSDIEGCGLPGVVNDGSKPGSCGWRGSSLPAGSLQRQNVMKFKVVKQTRGRAEDRGLSSRRRIDGCLKRFARMEDVTEVEVD